MKKLNLLFDADDVLENLVECWVCRINKKYGTSVKVDDITGWTMSEFFPELKESQIRSVLNEPELWHSLEPKPKSVDTLQAIKSEGHNIQIVTTSHFTTIVPKAERLLEMFPFISWDDITVTSKKQSVIGDALFDDGFHNLVGGKYHKYLVDRPWNRNYNERFEGMIRVYDFDDIYFHVDRLSKILCDDKVTTSCYLCRDKSCIKNELRGN